MLGCVNVRTLIVALLDVLKPLLQYTCTCIYLSVVVKAIWFEPFMFVNETVVFVVS